jgi:predicted methyltransferase
VAIERVTGDHAGSDVIDVVLGDGSLTHRAVLTPAAEAQGFVVVTRREEVGRATSHGGTLTVLPTVVLRRYRGIVPETSVAWQACSCVGLVVVFIVAAVTFVHLLHM